MTVAAPLVTEKRCSRCREVRPATAFARDYTKSTGLSSQCKLCQREVSKAWREANRERSDANVRRWRAERREVLPEIQRRYALKKTYGLTPEEFEALRLAQDGKCAVCEREVRTLVVDHCHETGVVRGLLCIPCNSGIGMLRDDPKLLRAALRYLRRSHG